MKLVVRCFAAALLLATSAGLIAQDTAQSKSAAPNVPTMSLDQVKTGMKGVAYTVFEGTQPEAMDLVVLGVLRNMTGPKSDVILVRLEGKKPEYTGVVAGMSGSPVYIDGKLVGAIAYRIGEFSKEPIAGVTPIGQMLEINAMDSTPSDGEADRKSVV